MMHDGSAILRIGYQAASAVLRRQHHRTSSGVDDLAQEVALALLDKPDAISLGLACRIAQRHIADRHRSEHGVRRRRPDRWHRPPAPEGVLVNHCAIEARDWWAVTSRRLSRCDRLLLLLTARGWSQRQLAARCGMTQVGVLKRLRRIREMVTNNCSKGL